MSFNLIDFNREKWNKPVRNTKQKSFWWFFLADFTSWTERRSSHRRKCWPNCHWTCKTINILLVDCYATLISFPEIDDTWSWKRSARGCAQSKNQNASLIICQSLIKFIQNQRTGKISDVKRAKPLHWVGIPPMLQAVRRPRDKIWLMGSWTGTLAVKTRQAQSVLVLISHFKEAQQLGVGVERPFALLPVMKFRHGVTLEIIEVVHGVEICPCTETTKRVANNVKITWK